MAVHSDDKRVRRFAALHLGGVARLSGLDRPERFLDEVTTWCRGERRLDDPVGGDELALIFIELSRARNDGNQALARLAAAAVERLASRTHLAGARLRAAAHHHGQRCQRREDRNQPVCDPRRQHRPAGAQDPAGHPGRAGAADRGHAAGYQLMVLLASWCALRFGELTELRRGDIDLSGEVIRVQRAVVRAGGEFTVTTPKSEAGQRDVAIPPHLLPTIEKHLANHVEAPRDSLLFPAVQGEHLAPATLYRQYYKARDAAGRPDLRFHDLRHSGAVLAAATGASLAELMARLGHSTPQAAMRYQHAAAGRDREIAALLSKMAHGG